VNRKLAVSAIGDEGNLPSPPAFMLMDGCANSVSRRAGALGPFPTFHEGRRRISIAGQCMDFHEVRS
jgi:hypothetical protein